MLRLCAHRTTPRLFSLSRPLRRHLHVDYESKYSEKLQKHAQELGKPLNDLRQGIKETERARLQKWSEEKEKKLREEEAESSSPPDAAPGVSGSKPSPVLRKTSRKDNSPVKPLDEILNLEKLLGKPHTADQISSLWTAYHASRSKGTGRGFICASVPLDIYNRMVATGKKYPAFAVPLPRDAVQDDSGEAERAYEFFFLQWGFHEVPAKPTPLDPFSKPPADIPVMNPQTSTVLLTPLQEYKSRMSFATPYLILTFYTDLANSHGLVLLRGEITPTAASAESNSNSDFLLSQQDAQLLTMHLQRFYLWGGEEESAKDRYRLLEAFHKTPEEFKWEDLLKHAEPI